MWIILANNVNKDANLVKVNLSCVQHVKMALKKREDGVLNYSITTHKTMREIMEKFNFNLLAQMDFLWIVIALVSLVPRDALLVAVPMYVKPVCLDMKRKADIGALKNTKKKKSYLILHVQKDNS